jgi:hypothetical protein
MSKRHHTKIVREGQYVAEVELELIDTDEGRLPYLSLEDAYKLGDVRAALRCGDLKTAARLARTGFCANADSRLAGCGLANRGDSRKRGMLEVINHGI